MSDMGHSLRVRGEWRSRPSRGTPLFKPIRRKRESRVPVPQTRQLLIHAEVASCVESNSQHRDNLMIRVCDESVNVVETHPILR